MVGFTWGYQVPLNKFPFLKGLVNEKANYMDEIAVDGNTREKGIGKLLGQNYIDKLIIANIPEIVLRTDQRNISSMTLFERLGFKSLEVTDPEYNYRIYLRRKLK